jgi:hypothetical protein
MCNGKGYQDWIDRAKGPGEEHQDYTYFISNTGDQISAAVKKGEEEEYKRMMRLQHTGIFKFKKKDEI